MALFLQNLEVDAPISDVSAIYKLNDHNATPMPNARESLQKLAVSGKVIAPKGRAVTALTINDEEYPISVSEEAGFYRKIKLVEGENTIKIKAEDTEGALTEKVISVFYNTQKDEKPPENIVSPVNKDEETKSENPYTLALAASIIKISGKKVEFCAGTSDGIQVNDVLKIKRGKSVIGKIKVLSVSDSKSTGEVVELNKNIKIHKSDSVVTHIKPAL